MNENSKVAVLGGGPFGLIITSILSPRVYPVYLWYADSRQAERLKKERVGQVLNNPYKIHENVEVISGYGQFADKPWVLLVVVPSRQFEDTLEHIIAQLSPDEEHLIVIFTKGVVSRNTRRKLGCVTFSQFVELQAEQHKRRVKVAVVNGPSLLSEIYSSHYSFFNIGCNDETAVAYLKDILTNEYIQAASSTDVIGVELGGVMKNPVAIACGIAEGLPQSGVNLQGMVLSQGFKEIFRLATSLGAVPNTLFGVSGLADLIATATSPTGRNRSYGVQFIRKLMAHENDPGLMDRVELFFRPTQFIEKEVMKNQDLIEGALAIGPILEIAADRNIRMPLFKVVYDILSRTRKPDALVTLFGGSPRANLETAAAAARMPGISRAAGQNFKRLIERRIFHQVSGTRGMFDRIQKQCDNILSNLDRRLQKARKKKNVRELEELPREMELWTRLKSCEPGALHNCVEDLIRFYVNEISDNYNPAIRGPLIRTLAPMRWMTGGMHSGAAIPYVGGQVDELRNLAERYNILYAPVHRSHLDSVEVAFGLSWSRLPVPRYAAGINLMTSPFMSRVLKSLGAYAVDRERTRNILYLECLTRYATMMLEVGIPSLVYPEGTRSRNGAINPIKTGLLSTAIDAYLSSGSEILIVPLALSYENVPEDAEFCGAARKTNFNEFIKTRTRVYLDVCEPIHVSRHIHLDDPTAAIAYQITSAWRKGLRILPNQVIARLLNDNDHAIEHKAIYNMVDEFVHLNPGNYLTRDTDRIVKMGVKILKGRKFIKTGKGVIRSEQPGFIEYYAGMTPEESI